MAAVNAIKAGDKNPVGTKESFKRLMWFNKPGMPLNVLQARILYSREVLPPLVLG
jgi:hypothetical protein